MARTRDPPVAGPVHGGVKLRLLLLPLALGLVNVAGERTSHAELMVTSWADLDAASKSVVIARLAKVVGPAAAPTAYELTVERALRGAATGTIVVRPSADGHAHFAVGTRLVAFVNGSSEWRAAASLESGTGTSLEDGVLRVEGFYDFDGHWISPGVMTLPMLESYLKGTTPTWTFRGKVKVGGSTAPSTIEVVATSAGGTSTVTGMPPMAGFPAPAVHVGPWMGNAVEVDWQRDLGRPLALVGTATGKNADGSIAVEWRPSYPGTLTEADFRRYLADPKLGHPYYVIDVALADGTHASLQLGREIGRVGELTPAGGGPLPISSLSTAPVRNVVTGSVTLVLDPPRTPVASTHAGSVADLASELYAGPIGCSWTKAGAGGATQRCTLGAITTRFAPP